MLTSIVDKDKIMALSKVEWVEWVEPFKKILPSYPSMALKANMHHNTINNVMRGISDNPEAKEVIIEAIEVALKELQQATSQG